MDEKFAHAGEIAHPKPETQELPLVTVDEPAPDAPAAATELAAPPAPPPATLQDAIVGLLCALDVEASHMPAPVADAWSSLGDEAAKPEPEPAQLATLAQALLSAMAAAPLGWESDPVREARRAVEALLAAPPVAAEQPKPAALEVIAADFSIENPGGESSPDAEAELALLRVRLANAEAERDGIHATWFSTAAERDGLRAELAAFTEATQTEIAGLNQALAVSAQLNRDVVAERVAAQAEAAELREQLRQAREQLVSLTAETEEWRTRLENANALSREQLAQRLADLKEAEAERDVAQVATNGLREQLVSVTAERDAARSELAGARDAMAAAAAVSEATIGALKARAERAELDVARLESRERELSRDLAQLQASTASHRDTLAKAAELQRSLEQAQREAAARADGAIAMARDLRTEHDRAIALLDLARHEIQILKDALWRATGWPRGRRTKRRMASADECLRRIGAQLHLSRGTA